MEGLEISEIWLSEVLKENDSFRFDAEYFGKIYLANEKHIKSKKFSILNSLTSLITDGKHGGVTLTESGVLFLRNTNVKEGVIDLSDKRFISCIESAETKRAELNEGDILLTTIGSIIGESVVIPKNFPHSTINQNLVKIEIKNKDMSEYISTFFNSKYGRNQIYRFGAGNIWFLVNYPNLRNIKIPLFSSTFYLAIKQIISRRNVKLEESKTLYSSAENLLLLALGLNDFQGKKVETNYNIKSFKDSFLTSGRLDAEYYQPKYEVLEKRIKSYEGGYKTLSELVFIKKSVETGSDAYADSGIPYIRVSNLTKYGISMPDIHISDEYYQKNKMILDNLKLKKDTILLSKDGSIGIAHKVSENLNMITSGALLHLTIKNTDEFLPDCLALILNSEIVQKQAERDAGGSIIVHWRVSEIENVVIPMLSKQIQTQISSQVQESFVLRAESERLLALAKEAVEVAIEQGEMEAEKLLLC